MSYVEAVLKESAIVYIIRDSHIADLLAGANGLFPKRLAVAENDLMQARRVLTEVGQFYDD